MNTKTQQLTLTRFIFSVLKPRKNWVFLMALLGVIWAFTSTFMPWMLKMVIDNAVSSSGARQHVFQAVMPWVAGYLSLWLLLCVSMRFLDWVRLKLFPVLREDISMHMFSWLTQHSHRYFQNNLSGSLINKINDMQSAVINILNTVDDVYSQSLGLLVAMAVLFTVHPIFAFIMLGWVIVFLTITFLFLRPIKKYSQDYAESITQFIGNMVDSISNIMNVRLFARFSEENRYIEKNVKEAVKRDQALQARVIRMRIFWDATIILLLGVNLIVLVNMYSKNLVTIGDFTFVTSLSISILWNLWFVAGQFVSFTEQVGRCNQALSIISAPHEIVDALDASPLELKQGEIRFSDVTFHYDEGARLFDNKNILIEGGQKVGLVGFSGSGKSSFVNLILRLFEVESGEILIDGQNINHVSLQSLREHIALIPQDITLFHRNLLENIRFGSPSATDEEVIAAAKKAHCHEFISQLTEGYQSLVGERGIKLSGGQRQRIAIARAILKNAPLLILDEATSSLDSVTEQYIQESLYQLMQNKTTIVIAHRLSTLAKMDRILVFDKGRIIEDGTHDSLLALNGHYAKMWHMQAGGFLPVKEVPESGQSI